MPDVSKIKFRRKRRKGSATSSRQQAAPKRAAAAASRVVETEEEEVVDDVAEEDEWVEDAPGGGSGTPARRKSSSGSSPPEIRFLDEKELRIDPPQARMTVAARRRDFFRYTYITEPIRTCSDAIGRGHGYAVILRVYETTGVMC